jgi:hypothetical protein
VDSARDCVTSRNRDALPPETGIAAIGIGSGARGLKIDHKIRE